jgi:hypothetical protein
MSYGKKVSIDEARKKIKDGLAKWSTGLSEGAIQSNAIAGRQKGKVLSDSLYWRQWNEPIDGLEGAYYVKVQTKGNDGKPCIVYAKATENITNQLKLNLVVDVEIRLNVQLPDERSPTGFRTVSFAGFPVGEDSEDASPEQVSVSDAKKFLLKNKIKTAGELKTMSEEDIVLEYEISQA